MTKKMRVITWITVIMVDFLLINVGVEGWFLGFAYGSFSSLIKMLFLKNYFVSLILPIVLTFATYLTLALTVNSRALIDNVKQNITLLIILVALALQFSVSIVSYNEIKALTKTTGDLQQSINGNESDPSFYFHSNSVSEQLINIADALENVDMEIQNIESEIQYLER